MKDVITVYVNIDSVNEFQAENVQISMINFSGTFKTELFSGDILPGGVDTQIERQGEPRSLSARYILRGKINGEDANIFIENNGVFENGEFVTKPIIYTDCSELKYLETSYLTGRVEGNGEGKVIIHIMDSKDLEDK